MIVLKHEDVADLLPMGEAVEVIDNVMRTVSRGGAELPLRHVVPVGSGNMMGVMSGALNAPHCYGVKLVSLFPGNPEKGLSSHRGAVVLFEAETGGAVAMMDAGFLTAIRTAAASAVATRALARENATSLALIGYGEQAEHHLDAMMAVRPITRLHVAGRSAERAEAFAKQAAEHYPQLTAVHGTDVQAAVETADIVCTVTASPTPVLMGDWLPEGVHVNIVGASLPSKREVDDRVVERADIWVDYTPSTLAQAGEIVDMIKTGTFSEDKLKGEIGAVLEGTLEGRSTPGQITAYRSLGITAQDLAAAEYVYRQATTAGRGQVVTL
ncbi:ornithine cyclodeaminase family protein [uncultured Roseibium sp.]|uniref:ornithine cyclodeaminase family protein n=1 Tax=uncultured Roseibium sp. TaxID=1936171 RepID=UPI003216413D